MSTYVPPEVQKGLDAARKKDLKRRNKLRVEADGRSFRVLRFQEDGFTLDVEDAPHLRGLVDLYDGGRHFLQCLIVASEEEAGEMRYEFKRATQATDKPPVDFEQPEFVPAGLITNG
ncbi:hypothetical protein ACS3QZ_12380 [Shimia sp. W99]|uniref:Uncharacterized protein n=1 Tax=Shimia aestuarii TaxID=254406 RepID=A0A1I4JKK8_9RHOB|nr:hypothetical protein [Shimia aestuarii]SFL67080.1 hypothetical protein SAMN04488042_1011066 [Shimia aestuarii]